MPDSAFLPSLLGQAGLEGQQRLADNFLVARATGAEAPQAIYVNRELDLDVWQLAQQVQGWPQAVPTIICAGSTPLAHPPCAMWLTPSRAQRLVRASWHALGSEDGKECPCAQQHGGAMPCGTAAGAQSPAHGVVQGFAGACSACAEAAVGVYSHPSQVYMSVENSSDRPAKRGWCRC